MGKEKRRGRDGNGRKKSRCGKGKKLSMIIKEQEKREKSNGREEMKGKGWCFWFGPLRKTRSMGELVRGRGEGAGKKKGAGRRENGERGARDG